MHKFFFRLNFETPEAIYCFPVVLQALSLDDAKDLALSLERGVSRTYKIVDEEAPFLLNEVTESHVRMTLRGCLASGRQELTLRLWRVKETYPDPALNIDEALSRGLTLYLREPPEIMLPIGIIRRKIEPRPEVIVDVIDLARKWCGIVDPRTEKRLGEEWRS